MRRALPAVQLPGRDPEPRRARDAGLDPRGRRARLRALARVRRRVRQPGPRRLRASSATARPRPGPLATSWHSNKFLDPVTDGAVLPILHLNGCKIANPTVLARIPEDELRALMEGYGHHPLFVDGDDPAVVHQQLAAALDAAVEEIHAIQRAAREGGVTERPRWPMIVLRTPKGWTGPKEIDGEAVRGHVALAPGPDGRGPRRTPSTARSSRRGCAATGPRSCSTRTARSSRSSPSCRRTRYRRMSANPHANGGLLLRDLRLPDFRDYAVDVPAPGATTAEATRVLGTFLRDVMARNRENFRVFGPDETASNRLGADPRGDRQDVGRRDDPGGRAPRARRPRHGDAVGAPVPGLAGGLPPHRPARRLRLLRGVHPHHRLDVQPAREVAEGHARTSRGAGRSRRSTTCSPRSSGARTTTGSATRTRASSTTS